MKEKVTLLTILVCLAGCVPSLHPIYKPADLVEKPAIVGTWTVEQEIWRFAAGADKRYDVTYLDKDNKTGRFDGHLAMIGEQLFLDLFPKEPEIDAGEYYKIHLVPAHSFLRVDQVEPTLKMAAMNPEWIKKYLAEHPDAVKHDKSDDGDILLTADTAGLQAFLKACLPIKDAWGDAMEMKRVVE